MTLSIIELLSIIRSQCIHIEMLESQLRQAAERIRELETKLRQQEKDKQDGLQ